MTLVTLKDLKLFVPNNTGLDSIKVVVIRFSLNHWDSANIPDFHQESD
jgi:hypothetical protein